MEQDFSQHSAPELFHLLDPSSTPKVKINYGRTLRAIEHMRDEIQKEPSQAPKLIEITQALVKRLGSLSVEKSGKGTEIDISYRLFQVFLEGYALGQQQNRPRE